MSSPNIPHSDLLAEALAYASHHWAVFPLNGKMPAIPKRLGGRGVLDATSDLVTVTNWWSDRYAGCNIGGKVPENMLVLDVGPRHGGDESLAAHEKIHGKLPDTLTTVSGRGDGGMHLFFRRPPGKLSSRRLGPGLDIKTSTGYVVLAPSIHPESGKPYTRIDRPVGAPLHWLVERLLPEPATVRNQKLPYPRLCGPSIADNYSAYASWYEILAPHGLRCLDADPDADGARWLHPTATSACSATVRHGCLFVYSPNTVFDITEPSYPKGYTKFHAYAQLNHDGDMKVAARHLKNEGAA